MLLEKISNAELISGADNLAARGRNDTVELLRHLIEIERRELYLSLGYNSMFSYCRERLKYSEAGTYQRIRCARCLRKFPEVAELLELGAINLGSLTRACHVMNLENYRQILSEISEKSVREVELIVASFGYRPDKVERERIRVLRPIEQRAVFDAAHTSSPALFAAVDGDSGCADAAHQSNCLVCLTDNVHSRDRLVTPTNGLESTQPQETQYQHDPRIEFKFVGGADLLKLVDDAKALLSGKYPKGVSLEALFTEALTTLLHKISPELREARREARRSVPRAENKIKKSVINTSAKAQASSSVTQIPVITPTSERQQSIAKTKSRHIPAALRDKIYIQNSGRCGYVSPGPDGKRCTCTHDLEIDHRLPFAKGGSSTEPKNLRLLCRQHNHFEALAEFAPAAKFMSMIPAETHG